MSYQFEREDMVVTQFGVKWRVRIVCTTIRKRGIGLQVLCIHSLCSGWPAVVIGIWAKRRADVEITRCDRRRRDRHQSAPRLIPLRARVFEPAVEHVAYV